MTSSPRRRDPFNLKRSKTSNLSIQKSCEIELSDSKRTVEIKDCEIRQNREKWVGEKGTLEQALQQAKLISDQNPRQRFEKWKEEKEELSRRLETAHSDEQEVHPQVQNLQREKTRIWEQIQARQEYERRCEDLRKANKEVPRPLQ